MVVALQLKSNVYRVDRGVFVQVPDKLCILINGNQGVKRVSLVLKHRWISQGLECPFSWTQMDFKQEMFRSMVVSKRESDIGGVQIQSSVTEKEVKSLEDV